MHIKASADATPGHNHDKVSCCPLRRSAIDLDHPELLREHEGLLVNSYVGRCSCGKIQLLCVQVLTALRGMSRLCGSWRRLA